MTILHHIWRSMRPRQWTKNAVVLAPLVFARKFMDAPALFQGLAAVVLFCLASSATYLMNDLLDREKDRTHPVKCRRPIACRALAPGTAAAAAFLLGAIALLAAFLLNPWFGCAVLAYYALQVLYSTVLKQMVILDVMAIAMGFVLRVEGGAFAVNARVSNWLFLCTVLLALFLGFGKRRHELVLLDDRASDHREILREYSPYFLDQMMAVVTASTVVAYSLYTISPEVTGKLGTPYLYLTIPFVLYGIFRYLYLIHQRELGGSPSAILLNDRPLLVNIILWGLTVIVMLYRGAPPKP